MESKKDRILELHKQGHSYNYIQQKLKVSKGTISYHCGDGVKEKTRQRLADDRNSDVFFKRVFEGWGLQNDKSWFRYGETRKKNLKRLREYWQDEYGGKCYLSGRELDMINGVNVELDHIIPKSKGGTNTLDNLGICTKDANQSKADMSVEEYLELCKDVLKHHGYTIEKE